MSFFYAAEYNEELAEVCREEKKYILRALQYCQDDASTKKGWWYIDKHGQPRGPYSTEQMKLWNDAGHFSKDMMVRNGDNGVFSDLGSLGTKAFEYDAEAAFKEALSAIERVLDKYE